MERRTFLALLAIGGAQLVTGCSTDASGEEAAADGSAGSTPATSDPSVSPAAASTPAGKPLAGPLPAKKQPLPKGVISELGGPGRFFALTVDDGSSSEVVGAYCKWAQDSGARFTFFVTGQYDSWRENKKALAPLVESGQVQLGNHTWTHADLTSLSASGVADELRRCEKFLKNTYGVSGTPYFRPPYGYRNATVDKVAADLGYTVPTLWDGSLSDSGVVTEQFLIGAARKYFHAGRIVIGHANHDPVTRVYGKFNEIITNRRLSLVTLNDYYA